MIGLLSHLDLRSLKRSESKVKVYKVIDGKPVEQPDHPLRGALDAFVMGEKMRDAQRRAILFGQFPQMPPGMTWDSIGKVYRAIKAKQ